MIEGNRRLAAIQEIRGNLDKYPDRQSDLNSVPVLIFPDKSGGQDSNDVRIYLGVRHLLGFREWPPIAKAEFFGTERAKKKAV